MFSTGTETLSNCISDSSKSDIFFFLWEISNTFCEFVARFIFPNSDEASTVPRKMDLNWFIPALVKRRVGSDRGATGEEGTVYKHSLRSVHVVGGGGGVG